MARSRSRGQIVDRGKGRWMVKVFLGRIDGKRKYKSQQVRGSKREAHEVLTKLQREQDTQSLAVPVRLTVEEYLDRWLGWKRDISGRTHGNYATRIRTYINPHLGRVQLQKLTRADVQNWIGALAQQGLSPASIHSIHMVLRGALKDAVECDSLLTRNVAAGVKLPRIPKRAPTILTPEQIDQLIRTTRGDTYGPLWHLLLTTGLRPGEALALRWSDLKGGAVSVQQRQTLDGDGNRVIETGAKTAAGVRLVYLPGTTVQALEDHKRAQARRLGGIQEWIFCRRTGDRLPPSEELVEREWRKALRRAGLPQVRPYDARHSHATECITNGMHPKLVQERLGHATIRTTLETYSHVLPGAHEAAAAEMDGWRKQA